MRTPLPIYLFCVFASGVLLACDSAEPQSSTVVTDSAGTRIVTTIRTEWTEPLPITVPPAIASMPATGSPTPLSRVLDARLLSDDRIAVLDGQLEQVIFYDDNGREVFSFGRSGQGPGEFVRAISLQEVEPGVVEVFDLVLNRLTRIEADGGLGPVTTLPSSLPRSYRTWRLPEGSLLSWGLSESAADPSRRTDEAEVWVNRGLLVRFDPESESADTILEGRLSASIRQGDGSGARIWEYPLGEQSVLVVANGGRRIVYSANQGHEITVLEAAASGEFGRSQIFRFPSRDEAIPDEELSRLTARSRQALAEEGASSTRALEFLFDRRIQPAVRPAFRKILVASDGTIWAQAFEPRAEPAPFWWIISPDGAFRGLVRLPDGHDILSLRDGLMLVERLNEYDVPTVDVVSMPALIRGQM